MSTILTPAAKVREDHPTGSLAAVAAAVVVILSLVGVSLPVEVALGAVALVAAVVSFLTPRFGSDLANLAKHPAGLAGAATAVLAYVATLIGLDLDAAGAAVIVGGVTVLVSAISPRWRSRVTLKENVPTNDGTGPGG